MTAEGFARGDLAQLQSLGLEYNSITNVGMEDLTRAFHQGMSKNHHHYSFGRTRSAAFFLSRGGDERCVSFFPCTTARIVTHRMCVIVICVCVMSCFLVQPL